MSEILDFTEVLELKKAVNENMAYTYIFMMHAAVSILIWTKQKMEFNSL